MNEGGSIVVYPEDKVVYPEDKEEKVIWTYGLGGCFATVVFSEDENGQKTAILTHFDPLNIPTNINVLRQLINNNSITKSSKYTQILVLGPYNYEQNPETKKWEQTTINKK